MIKTISACTAEIDDVTAAVAEISGQLGTDKLLAYSVGMVSCYADFISSGVIAALAKALPFPIVGTTTIAGAFGAGNTGSGGSQGEMLLVLTILTSDDTEFIAAVTDSISGEDDAPLRAAWEKTGALRADKPVMMLSFAPLLLNVSGDFYVETWSAITGNVPNFGTLAVDHNQDYHESQTILNGEAFRDRYVFVLFYGKTRPLFFMGGISEKEAFKEKGVVTAAQGNLLQAVNGVSVADYLTGLGLTKDTSGNITGINSYPFILDYNDGSAPVVRVMFAVTPDGSAVCGGKIPKGATLTVGYIDAGEVLKNTDAILASAIKALEERKSAENSNGGSMLIFSCVGRFFAQGFNTSAEMDNIRSALQNIPFHLCYSGTELCPVRGRDGSLVNRSHNDTIILCVL
ncbi:hypothetical protein AGMMS50293_22660 [Spirochaetia bacterium]|nr:hypothetical protein AGMMS50293_22660 [Spirochaetia bacterium]